MLMPSVEVTVARGTSVKPCKTCATHSHPSLVVRAYWCGWWLVPQPCLAIVRATNLRTTSPATMSRTPPSGFDSAVILPNLKRSTTPFEICARAKPLGHAEEQVQARIPERCSSGPNGMTCFARRCCPQLAHCSALRRCGTFPLLMDPVSSASSQTTHSIPRCTNVLTSFPQIAPLLVSLNKSRQSATTSNIRLSKSAPGRRSRSLTMVFESHTSTCFSTDPSSLQRVVPSPKNPLQQHTQSNDGHKHRVDGHIGTDVR